MTVLEILEAKYTKDRTEYTIKFKPVAKKLGNLTKDDVTITYVSDGNKEDYEVIDFTYTKANGGSITFKTTKDPITAEITVKFKDIEEEFTMPTAEKTAEATPPAASETESGHKEESKPQETSPEEHKETETIEFGRREATLESSSTERAYSEQPSRFASMFNQPKAEFTPIEYGLYYKNHYDVSTAGTMTAYESEISLAYKVEGDLFMRPDTHFQIPIYEGTHKGDVFMVINNYTEAELEEYISIRLTGNYYKTYKFEVLKEHPEAVTKPFTLDISFIRRSDMCSITRFKVDLAPVNHALKLPEVKNNKKVPGPVFTLKTSKNFYETLLNVFIEKNEDYFELVKWTAEGYSFTIPFRNPATIVYCSCYPHEAPNRAKKFIAFVQLRAKFPGEFTIVWTVKGKNGAVADIRQKVQVLGTPSPTDGMTPDEKEEFLIYGPTALERDMVFNYNSLSRKVKLYVDDSYVSKFNKPGWALDREYRFVGGINTDLLRLKEFFDKNPTLPVEVYSNSFYGKVIAANFVDFLNTYKSGEGKEYTMYDPPYYRTWLEREYKRKKEIDYIKMAEEMGW